jgi:hypothetical protein
MLGGCTVRQTSAYRYTASTATTIGHIVASDWKSAVLETNPSVAYKEIGRTTQSEMRDMGKSETGKLREGLRALMTVDPQLVYSLIALKREFCAYKVPNVWRYAYQGKRRIPNLGQ